jgi:protein TonB
MADASPEPSAAVAVVTPAPPSAPAAVAPPEPAPPSVQLPSSDADYLQNPKPPYPPLSMRLGETGKVVYKVWIGTDGKAERAELVKSSGFARLDSAAYDTVMRWRYVPGTRNGVAQAMPFDVPINWKLRN